MTLIISVNIITPTAPCVCIFFFFHVFDVISLIPSLPLFSCLISYTVLSHWTRHTGSSCSSEHNTMCMCMCVCLCLCVCTVGGHHRSTVKSLISQDMWGCTPPLPFLNLMYDLMQSCLSLTPPTCIQSTLTNTHLLWFSIFILTYIYVCLSLFTDVKAFII